MCSQLLVPFFPSIQLHEMLTVHLGWVWWGLGMLTEMILEPK